MSFLLENLAFQPGFYWWFSSRKTVKTAIPRPFPCCGWLRFVVSWAFRQLLADLAEAAKEKTEPR